CSPACQAGCVCMKGFCRNKTGPCYVPTCVPIGDCLGKNQEWSDCGSACPKRCEQKEPMACIEVCREGCFCKKGFCLDKLGQCVADKTSILPAPANTTCGKNEEHNTCHNPCTEKKCPQKNAPLVNCLMACMDGCSCKSGFLRNMQGECVKEAECPAVAPVDENPCNLAECAAGHKCVPKNGEATCIPVNPHLCSTVLCAPPTQCQVVNSRARCVKGTKTLPRSSKNAILVPEDPPASITCANVRCAGRGGCLMVEPAGCIGCKQGPQCLADPSCDNTKCKSSHECVMVQNTCVKAPCLPTPECRPKKLIQPFPVREPRQVQDGTCMTVRCGTSGGCALTRPMSCDTLKPDGKCPLRAGCVEENPCAATSCLVGTQCVLHEVQCIRAPCPPIAQCEPLNDAPAPGDKRCPGKNQKWVQCKTACSDVNCNEEPRMCAQVCRSGGCVCQEGFFRNKRGQCVTQNDCDAQKGNIY
ncbi:Protein CBG20702, partial [Caenorhabditis briggsae]